MRKVATGLALAILSATSASAADETFNVTFTANNFTSNFGQPAVDPVEGSFTITLDPAKTYLDETVGITLDTLNIALAYPIAFDYSPTGTVDSTPGELVVGGTNDGAARVIFNPPTSDLWLFIDNFFTTHNFDQLGYSQAYTQTESLFFTTDATGTVTVTPVTGGVPEPSTWAMLLLGFAGLGYAGFRRTSKLGLA
jgi:PEP-CTERM motif